MPRIEAIWAFVSVDVNDGNEGVLASTFGRHLLPLIAADEKRLKELWPAARQIASVTGMRCKLVKFHAREEIEEF
jgi:hypothetical protein